MPHLSLGDRADIAISKLQDTQLTPMEEALFQAWTKANQIKKPDAPNDRVDYRGIYRATGGAILPNGQLKEIADKTNAESELQTLLQQRMMDHVDRMTKQKVGEQNAAASAAKANFGSSS